MIYVVGIPSWIELLLKVLHLLYNYTSGTRNEGAAAERVAVSTTLCPP